MRRRALNEPLIKYKIDRDWVVQRLAAIADAKLSDYATVNEQTGLMEIDLSSLTVQQSAAIRSLTVDQSAGGAGDGKRKAVERVKLTLHDPVKALELLGREQKLFTDKVEVTADDNIIAALAAGRERVKRGSGTGEGG